MTAFCGFGRLGPGAPDSPARRFRSRRADAKRSCCGQDLGPRGRMADPSDWTIQTYLVACASDCSTRELQRRPLGPAVREHHPSVPAGDGWPSGAKHQTQSLSLQPLGQADRVPRRPRAACCWAAVGSQVSALDRKKPVCSGLWETSSKFMVSSAVNGTGPSSIKRVSCGRKGST